MDDDDDEVALRAFVSRQWAEDWDSPEDAVYDELPVTDRGR